MDHNSMHASLTPKSSNGMSDDDQSPTTSTSAFSMNKSSVQRTHGLKADRPKYTRLLQSCDSCRARKVRCVQVDSIDPEKDGIAMTIGPNGTKRLPYCKPCLAAGIGCVYNFKAKKRGPPNQHVRRLRAAAAASNSGDDTALMDPNVLPGTGTMTLDPKPSASVQSHRMHSQHPASSSHTQRSGSSDSASILTQNPSLPSQSGSDIPVSPMTVIMARSGVIGSDWHVSSDHNGDHHHMTSSPTNMFTGQPLASTQDLNLHGSSNNFSPQSHSSPASSMFPPPPPPQTYPPVSTLYTGPYSQSNPSVSSRTVASGSPLTPHIPAPLSPVNASGRFRLTDLAPTTTILHVLSLFFDFIWPLTPCVHRPSFYHDLGEKREERDPLFFALVCSTIAATLVQVPRSYLPMDRDEVRRLARRFNEASKMAAYHHYDPPTTTLVVVKYFDNIYYYREGREGSSNGAFGETMYIATALNMHLEDSYAGLDCIEAEVRRRIFWLLYGADKSICAISTRPCAVRMEDCTAQLPREVDDERITTHRILPQPPGKTPIMTGFNYISRIFSLIGEIITIIRCDTHKPPRDAAAVSRLEEVCDIHRRISRVFDDAPPELRLRTLNQQRTLLTNSNGLAFPGLEVDPSNGSFKNINEWDGAGYAQAAIAEINQFFDNPNASREDAGNAFLVMQANIYVTQHMARLMAEQHRHELVTSIRSTGYDLAVVHSPTVTAELARGGWTADDREAVARDLLQVLHSIPILSIATNGASLVHKVRFVASTLLDSIREADTAPTPAARALKYLWDFLSILSEIERNYSLGEETTLQSKPETRVA